MSVGDLIAISERVGDDRGGDLEDQGAQARVLRCAEVDAGVSESVHDGGLVEVIAGFRAGEKPALFAMCGCVLVRQGCEMLSDDGGERLRPPRVLPDKAGVLGSSASQLGPYPGFKPFDLEEDGFQ